ncbi:Hypothetical protein Tcol_2861 [Trichococcus collinsii]|uniref:Uncharacterized protein n=1 Tax=Trichococcus collinsii TaxID=157076 RepID=A0AB37ZY96_9LACT|nr:Hypothetical protein Tcol_2861 [Trichococcus collinsii]SEA16778.1 hypothetical protein SAMN04488525_102140 [Trichococcus collinsii]
MLFTGNCDVSVPEEKIQKDHQLRPRRLRRSTAVHKSVSSGEQPLAGVELPGAIPFSDEGTLIGADSQKTIIG